MTRSIWIGLLASFAAMMAASTPAAGQQQKPNILFILADNVGYGDIGAYGGGELRGAPTPRIDQLAAESLRMTQFLVEPGCTPSRAASPTIGDGKTYLAFCSSSSAAATEPGWYGVAAGSRNSECLGHRTALRIHRAWPLRRGVSGALQRGTFDHPPACSKNSPISKNLHSSYACAQSA
jgi:Sulfatase